MKPLTFKQDFTDVEAIIKDEFRGIWALQRVRTKVKVGRSSCVRDEWLALWLGVVGLKQRGFSHGSEKNGISYIEMIRFQTPL